MDNVLLQALNGIQLSMLIYLLAVGLSLIFGLLHVINLAHGALYAVGAYLGVVIVGQTGSFWLGALLSPLLVAGAAFLLQRYMLGPLHNHGRTELELALLTFGLMFVIVGCLELVFGVDFYRIAVPESLQGHISLFDTEYPVYRFFVIALGVAVAIALWLLIDRTLLGAAVRSCVDDGEMAMAVGLNTRTLLALFFGLGAALAALGGVVAAPVLSVYPHMGTSILILSLIVVIVGGMGSLKGSLVGSLVIGSAESFSQAYVPAIAMYAPYLVLVAVILFKPAGLFGRVKH